MKMSVKYGLQGFWFLVVLSVCVVSQADAQTTKIFPPFGGTENRYKNPRMIEKWDDLLTRLDAASVPAAQLRTHEQRLKALPEMEMVREINKLANNYPYLSDNVLWGVIDYWAVPPEFFGKGGDCEDYAITKYAWLRFLGVPESRLRIAIVHDRIQQIPHAVTIVYLEDKAVVLDNQVADVRDNRTVSRYRVLYSMNRTNWWIPQNIAGGKISSAQELSRDIQPASGQADVPQAKCADDRPLSNCLNEIKPSGG